MGTGPEPVYIKGLESCGAQQCLVGGKRKSTQTGWGSDETGEESENRHGWR